MTEERAEAEFGVGVLEFHRNSNGEAEPADKLTARPVDFRPGCFGFYFEQNNAEELCGGCTYLPQCQERSGIMGELATSLLGDKDPRMAEKRRQARERKRAQRAREAARKKDVASRE